MQRVVKVRAVALFGLLVIIALGFVLLTAAKQRQRDRYQYYTGGPNAALPALIEEHGYELRELEVAPDVRLRGILRLPSSDGARFVLFFPGNSEPQLSASLPTLEALRAGRDLGIAMFTYRGFDGSGGRPSPQAAEHDARAELAYIRDRLHIAPERTVLVGYSMGSGIALRLAAELSRTQQPPAAVILLSPYWTLELGPASPFELLLPSEFYRIADIAAEYRGPVLVVAGAQDEALPAEQHARKVLAALRPGAEYWELPGRGHVDYLEDRALLARIGSFALDQK
jgi:uncharacterized protein